MPSSHGAALRFETLPRGTGTRRGLRGAMDTLAGLKGAVSLEPARDNELPLRGAAES